MGVITAILGLNNERNDQKCLFNIKFKLNQTLTKAHVM